MERFKQKLLQAGIPFRENEPLAAHCTFKIGGPAQLFVQPQTEQQLCSAVALCKEQAVRYYLLGNGSNILFADEGFAGVVIDISALGSDIAVEGNMLTAGAGVRLAALCRAALEHGLSGLEFAYGIPGSVGGGVFMNAGAYDHSLEEVVSKSRFYDPKSRTFGEYKGKDHCFSYRHSVYNDGNRVILSAEFSLKKDDPQEIRARMEDYMQRRKSKQPLEYPSAGSVFKRYPGYFTAKLIEEAGLKGLTVGGAQVSPKHAGFIVNLGSATAADVQKLVSIIEEEIYRRNGIRIERELIYF